MRGKHFYVDAEDLRCNSVVFVPSCWLEPSADSGQSCGLLSSIMSAYHSRRDGSQLIAYLWMYMIFSFLSPYYIQHLSAMLQCSHLLSFHVFCLPNMGENNYFHLKNQKELRTGTDLFQSSCPVSDKSSHKARIIKNMMFWKLLDIWKFRARKMSLFSAWRKQSPGEILLWLFNT